MEKVSDNTYDCPPRPADPAPPIPSVQEARIALVNAVIQYGLDSAQTEMNVLVGGNDVQDRIDALIATVSASHAATIQQDDQRLRDAAARAGVVYFGCDTPDALAERILEQQATIQQQALEGLPASLSASLQLWWADPQAWDAEWSRTHQFKVDLIKRAEAAESALARMQEAGQWQPIETAPKDGTVVLWVPNRYPHVSVGSYWNSSDEGLTWGWWTQSGSRVEPTHWQPLPPSPVLVPPCPGNQ